MTQTRLKGAERRERFLDAAAQIVIEQGVAAVTMDGVAHLTGVTKALGYRYFTDRDDLLTALFDRETQIYVERLATEVGPSSSFEDWVRGALKYWCRRADERGELFMRLVRDCGPLAERARKANRKADADGWALGLQKAFGLPARQAKQYAWFMVAGTAGALDAREWRRRGHDRRDHSGCRRRRQGLGQAIWRTPFLQSDLGLPFDRGLPRPLSNDIVT
jgi:AcrR family transcriptional regulator